MKCKDCGSKDIGAFTDQIVEVELDEYGEPLEVVDTVEGFGDAFAHFCRDCGRNNISGIPEKRRNKMKETLATEVVNCPKCGSTNIEINLCAYWTLKLNENLEIDHDNLTIETSDNGLCKNSVKCLDCEWEKQLN